MKILAFELSTARGSLAWAADDADLRREWPNDRKNSGPFFENVKLVVEKFGWPKVIVVGLGPGSYAGVRIAIATGLGLQAAARAQFIGFPSICAMEAEREEYCAIGDARRQSFFFARIRANNLVEGPTLFTEIELKDKLAGLPKGMPVFVSEHLPQFKGAIVCYPSASVLARLALDSNRNFSRPPLEPIYLREPHITLPKS